MKKLVSGALLALSVAIGLVLQAPTASAAALPPAEGGTCSPGACTVTAERSADGKCRIVCRGDDGSTCEVVIDCPVEGGEECGEVPCPLSEGSCPARARSCETPCG